MSTHEEPVDADPSGDARARRRAKTPRALRYAAVTGTVGALVVFACWAAADGTNGTHWTIRTAWWIICGGAFGAIFGPFFAFARSDGEDDEILRTSDGVAVHGQSDTSTEGAFAQDLRRADHAE